MNKALILLLAFGLTISLSGQAKRLIIKDPGEDPPGGSNSGSSVSTIVAGNADSLSPVVLSTATPQITTTWSQGADTAYLFDLKTILNGNTIWYQQYPPYSGSHTTSIAPLADGGPYGASSLATARLIVSQLEQTIYNLGVTFYVDTTNPSGQLNTSGNNVNISAYDNVGLKKIEFYVGGALYATTINATAPGVRTINEAAPLPLVPGLVSIFAKIYDLAGHWIQTPAVQITNTIVNVTPSKVTLLVGSTQQFTALVQGASNTAVTWSTNGGEISPSGFYRAPATPGFYSVWATSQADTTRKAKADLAVEGFQKQRWISQSGAFGSTQQYVAADFNGDGRCDIARIFNDGGYASIDVFLAQGNNTFMMQRWATQQGGYDATQKWIAADFTGDGRADLACVFNDGGYASIDVHPSTGSTFGIVRWATQQGGFWSAQKWVAGDFNRDGHLDLACIFSDSGYASIDAHLSDGISFGITRWATQQGSFNDIQSWVPGDYNGDGFTDLACVFNDNQLASIDVHLSSGSSFGITRWATQQGAWGDGNSQKWASGDFNGFHRSDLIKASNDNNLASIDLHTLSGSAFVMQRWATQQGGFHASQRWVTGDFNGDGLCDFACIFDDTALASIDVHTSKP